jgi:hypothetical protein
LIILKVEIVLIDWFFTILDFITELIKKRIANKLSLRKETKLILEFKIKNSSKAHFSNFEKGSILFSYKSNWFVGNNLWIVQINF